MLFPHENYNERLQKQKLLKADIKDALSGVRRLSSTESPLKMMKNAHYFTLKALFILKIFKICPTFRHCS